MIGHIVKKWQRRFEIHDGGNRHLQLLQLCIFDVINMFQIEVPMFPIILVTIGQMVKMAAVFEIQDGRHLVKYTAS